ncbi:MAG: hypothetical protein AAFX06_21210 [Planctomycetota bacterium]
MRFSHLTKRFLIVAGIVAITSTSVDAGWNEFWARVGIGYKRNNAWPQPFNEVDAMSVITPFEAMKANGWRLHNTIINEQFRYDGALASSGQEHIRWIATQALPTRRQIFVLRGATEEATQARVASVRDALAKINHHGPSPEVFVTDVVPATAGGAWATAVQRGWLDQLPAPKLPTTSAAGTASATN